MSVNDASQVTSRQVKRQDGTNVCVTNILQQSRSWQLEPTENRVVRDVRSIVALRMLKRQSLVSMKNLASTKTNPMMFCDRHSLWAEKQKSAKVFSSAKPQLVMHLDCY